MKKSNLSKAETIVAKVSAVYKTKAGTTAALKRLLAQFSTVQKASMALDWTFWAKPSDECPTCGKRLVRKANP